MRFRNPLEFAAAPFASGVPTVSHDDSGTGPLQAGNESGGPCVRFAAEHGLNAGVSGTRMGVAPLGRG